MSNRLTPGYPRAHGALYGHPKRPSRCRRDLLPDFATYYLQCLKGIRPGGNWARGRCPFHEDKNPSLPVYLTHGDYLCFGCGARGGDVLDFHMKLNNMDFVTAAMDLNAWEND